MKKTFELIRKNMLGFVIGLVFTLVIGVVSAATIASSANLNYTTSIDSSITNVKQALDTLYNVKPEIVHYAFGNPTTSSPTDYSVIVAQGYNVFAALYSDGSKAACAVRNGKLGCFKNGTSNWASNKYLVQAFFSDISCNVQSTYVKCNDGDFNCFVYSDGDVFWGDIVPDKFCDVNAAGSVACG